MSTISKHLFIFFAVVIAFSCSVDSNDNDDGTKQEENQYFSAVTQTVDLSREQIIDYAESLLGQTALSAFIPDRTIRIDAVEYRTQSPDGKPVVASGTIAYPVSGTIKGVVVSMHMSMMSNSEVPSVAMLTAEAAMAMFGYAVVSPDMIGFGSTRSLPHPYTHAQSMGQVGVDMLFAAREYLGTISRSVASDQVLVEGYSLGGYGAVAFQKMAESKYADKIAIKRVIAGGGPYDLVATKDSFVQSGTSSFPCGIAATVVGLDYADDLELDMSEVFVEPLLSSYDKWFNSKDYDAATLNHNLSDDLHTFMHDDLFSSNPNSELLKLEGSLKRNSLVEGWTPVAPITIIHARMDSYVPFVNAENIYSAFYAKVGERVKLTVTDGDHADALVPFITALFAAVAL